MRWPILKALLVKEWHRHLANRGGLALLALLVGVALLLSAFRPAAVAGGAAPDGNPVQLLGVHHCFVETVQRTDTIDRLVAHLKANVPPELRAKVVFRRNSEPTGILTYPPGTGAIQLRAGEEDGAPAVLFNVWHPPGEPGSMAPYEYWFFRESLRGLAEQVRAAGGDPGPQPPPELDDDLAPVRAAYRRIEEAARGTAAGAAWPKLRVRREGLGGLPIQWRDAAATSLILFGLYFTCCYLLPTLSCEERERGVLLAQALSPASPAEILMAKFLFYPALGIGLGALIAAVYRPVLLTTPFFWAGMVAVGGGFLGIGMTVASLARTQRGAFLGAMGYLLGVTMVLMVSHQNGIPVLPELALEHHSPKVLYAAVTGRIGPMEGFHLAMAILLAAGWLTAASILFRRRGWQ